MAAPASAASESASPPPELIDLAKGWPSTDLLSSRAMVERATAAVASQSISDLLNYGPEQGDGKTRAAIAAFVNRHARKGCDPAAALPAAAPVDPDELFLCGGVSQGLHLVAAELTKPGEVCFVEMPTYFLAANVLRAQNLDVRPIPADADGIDVDALAEACRCVVEEEKNRVALVYVIPIHQNPSGAVLSTQRRRALVQLAQERGFFILADEVYHLLTFDGLPGVPMMADFDVAAASSSGGGNSSATAAGSAAAAAAAGGVVVSVNSVSKILGPGLRIGWVHSRNRDVIARLSRHGYVPSGGGLNHFAMRFWTTTMANGDLDAHLVHVREELGRRARVLCDALVASDVQRRLRVRCPRGGYFVWVGLPPGVCGDDVARVAKADEGVRVFSGSMSAVAAAAAAAAAAHPPATPPSGAIARCEEHVRLCFAWNDSDEMFHEGAERLVRAVERVVAAASHK